MSKTQLPATITNLIDTLATARKAVPADSDAAYLKMDKTGSWIYGEDDTEVDPDSTFVINPSSYVQGFIAWDDGELIDERMAQAGAQPILLSDLPALEGGVRWDAQVGFTLRGVEGDEDGVILNYKSSSRGGKKAISGLLTEIIERGQSGETALCPIVELDSDSYKHKKFGKIYTPILRVVEWVDLPEEGEPVDPVEEDEGEIEEPVPVKKTRRRKKA